MEQRSVNIPYRVKSDGGAESAVGEEEEETKGFLFQYLSKQAQRDKDLPGEDAEMIQEQGQEVATRVRTGGDSAAVNVASMLADMGDDIDARYEEQMKQIVALSGNPETAFSIFSDVVKNLFEWDLQDGAKINVGRISALLAYCYHLVKTFILEKMAGNGVIFSFMCLVAGWLFKVFIKAKFYEWLRNQGGWGQLMISASSNFSGVGRNLYLFVGLASLTIWAVSYFRGN